MGVKKLAGLEDSEKLDGFSKIVFNHVKTCMVPDHIKCIHLVLMVGQQTASDLDTHRR